MANNLSLGRALFTALSSPRHIVAPMVDHSDLCWRLLSRLHSPPGTLCYTPMFHSRLFSTSGSYRQQSFQPHLDCLPPDRPTFVQFCANDPSALVAAARLVAPYCDAVDLNLGCPQGIARKGRYGAYLQDDWALITALLGALRDAGLGLPVCAKIRLLPGAVDRSVEYARMVVAAGASILCVHGRTREQRGHNTGLADWEAIRAVREALPCGEVVVFANGGVLWGEDVERCLQATGADAVMSAEGNLHNPAIFTDSLDWAARYPRVDVVVEQYLGIVRETVVTPHILPILQDAAQTEKRKLDAVMTEPSLTAVKSHLFKLLHCLLPRHIPIRTMLAKSAARVGPDPLVQFEAVLAEVRRVVGEELRARPEAVDAEGRWVGPDTDGEEGEGALVEVKDGEGGWRKARRRVPWYRCQPYCRPLPEEAARKGAIRPKKGEGRQGEERQGVERQGVEGQGVEGGQSKKPKLETGTQETLGTPQTQAPQTQPPQTQEQPV